MSDVLTGASTKEGDVLALTDLIAAHLGTDCKIGLYLSSYAPSRDSVFADLAANEANFNGYTRAATVFHPAGIDQNGVVRSLSDNELFTATDALVPNTLGGAFLTIEDAGPPVVNRFVRWYPFANPVVVNQAGQEVGVKVAITAPDLSGYAVAEL